MAYVQKIISKEEELHGIARLHWIYIIQGVVWFMAMAGFGWLVSYLAKQGLMMTASAAGSTMLPDLFLGALDWVTLFCLGGGFFLFMLFVIKVLFTEIGISNRRVIYKTGMVFIKVQQIDLEEIRGENIDLGWFGRFLGYGFIELDCRFIGDIKLPAIERPERFIRGLHALRANTQDSLSVVVGKGHPKPLKIENTEEISEAGRPDIEPGKPAHSPEVDPGNQPAKPEIQPEPTPHSPPPSDPPSQPDRPAQPPAQPTPAPGPNPQPPLQPPGDQAMMSADDVAKLLKEALPEMAHQVVAELMEKGLLKDVESLKAHPDIDNNLIHVFDDATQKQDGGEDEVRNTMGQAIH